MGLFSTRWPDVDAVLDSYSIHKTSMEVNDQSRYRADLFLSFKLGRQTFKTTKKTGRIISRAAVKHEIDRKYPDSQATLYYNPYNPKQCVLEPGIKGYWVIAPIIALLLAFGGIITYPWPIEMSILIIAGVGSLVVLNFLVFFGGHNNPDAAFWDEVLEFLETYIFGPPPIQYRQPQRKPKHKLSDTSASHPLASKATLEPLREVVEVRCSECGAKRRKTAKFCAQCGAVVIQKEDPPAQIDAPEVPEEEILKEIEIEESNEYGLPSDITAGSSIATLELFSDFEFRDGEVASEVSVEDQLDQLDEADSSELLPSSRSMFDETSSKKITHDVSPALEDAEEAITAPATAVLEDAGEAITATTQRSVEPTIEDVQPRFSALQYQVREMIFEQGVSGPIAHLFPYSGAMEEITVAFEETQIKMSGCLSQQNAPSVDLELKTEGEPRRLTGFDPWQTITLAGEDHILKRLKLRRGIARKMASLGTVTVKVDSPLIDKICIQIACNDSKESIAQSYALMKDCSSFLEYSLQY